MRRTLSLVLAAGLVVAAAAAQESGGPDLKQLQGTWTVVALTESGRKAPPEALKGTRMTVKDTAYRFVGGEDNYQGNLKLDPTQSPKHLDATFVDDSGAEKGKAYGIYELQGDTLKLCWRDKSKDRPTEFASTPKSGLRLIVLQRDKP